jgi:hypothetical protein
MCRPVSPPVSPAKFLVSVNWLLPWGYLFATRQQYEVVYFYTSRKVAKRNHTAGCAVTLFRYSAFPSSFSAGQLFPEPSS